MGDQLISRVEKLQLTRFHWILMTLIWVGIAFDFSDQITLSFVIPEYSKEWGLNPSVTFLNPTLGILGTVIGAFLFGRLSDRYGRKNLFPLTILIFAVTSGLNGFTPGASGLGFPWVVTNCFVMGIGVGGAIPLGFTLISEYIPARMRARAEIFIGMLAISGGYIVSALAAFLFLPYEGLYLGPVPLGWRTIFLLSAFTAIPAVVARLAIPESPRYLISKGRLDEALGVVRRLERGAGETDGVRRATPESAAPRGALHQGAKGPAKIWTGYLRRRTMLGWGYSILGQFFVLGFLVWLPSYLARLGFVTHEASIFGLVINLIAVPSALVTMVLFERWSTKKTLLAFSLVAGAGMLLFGLFASLGTLNQALIILFGAIITFFGVTIVMGAFPAYLTEIYPTELRGTGCGSAVSFGRIGAVIGIFVGGSLLASSSPALIIPLTFGIPIVLAGLLMLILGVETRRKTLEEISPV